MSQSRIMRVVGAALIPVALCLSMAPAMANPVTYNGVTFPAGDVSFADSLVKFTPGPGSDAPYNDGTDALGAPNYPTGGGINGDGSVALGNGGTIDLQFTDNSLTTSGTSAADLWVFEVGGAVEPSFVYVSTDGTTWISLGEVNGATDGVDLDAFTGSGITVGTLYSFVRLVDANAGLSGSGPYAGADIDAVGAISSGKAVDQQPPSVPEPNALALLAVGLIVVGAFAARRRRLGH